MLQPWQHSDLIPALQGKHFPRLWITLLELCFLFCGYLSCFWRFLVYLQYFFAMWDFLLDWIFRFWSQRDWIDFFEENHLVYNIILVSIYVFHWEVCLNLNLSTSNTIIKCSEIMFIMFTSVLRSKILKVVFKWKCYHTRKIVNVNAYRKIRHFFILKNNHISIYFHTF